MRRKLSLSLFILCLAAASPAQTKKVYIVFSSNSIGYLDPCG
jgi:hypothetical protein